MEEGPGLFLFIIKCMTLVMKRSFSHAPGSIDGIAAAITIDEQLQ